VENHGFLSCRCSEWGLPQAMKLICRKILIRFYIFNGKERFTKKVVATKSNLAPLICCLINKNKEIMNEEATWNMLPLHFMFF